MWNGKKKAVTFSFDDGVTQDIRLIEIFNKYGLKGTFNLNSGFLGLDGTLDRNGRIVRHDKIAEDKIKEVYKGHEVAVHTLTHPNLTGLEENEIIRQVEEDRLKLSELCGYEVVGMAYPGGGVNFDLRVADIIKKHTGVKYARTIEHSFSFELQKELYTFSPTVHHNDSERCLKLIDEFLALEADKPQLLYIWGHSYEFDLFNNWELLDEICSRISGHDDIFYGTNRECFGI